MGRGLQSPSLSLQLPIESDMIKVPCINVNIIVSKYHCAMTISIVLKIMNRCLDQLLNLCMGGIEAK